MTVLVDTGAWYALADRSDAHHGEARRWYQSRAPHEDLVTVGLILAETFTLLMSRLCFAIMERLGIHTAFSFDVHFSVVRLGSPMLAGHHARSLRRLVDDEAGGEPKPRAGRIRTILSAPR